MMDRSYSHVLVGVVFLNLVMTPGFTSRASFDSSGSYYRVYVGG